jgi:hypothetical protein
MNDAQDNENVDTWLRSALVSEPLVDDEEFTRAVLKQMERAATRRRAILTMGCVAAGVITVVSLPDASASWASITPSTLAGMMTLSALCSAVWIDTMD